MPRAKYTYHITPPTKRPLTTMQEVAEHLGLSVHVLRHRFATGSECIDTGTVRVCRKRVVCDSRYSKWWDAKRSEYGSRRAYDRARKGEQDND
jgi:hypothetical protein